MPLTLGDVIFDEAHTHVREYYEEVGGRDERRIIVSGLIVGENATAEIEARLDAILDAASAADYSAELSLRAGRRLRVRRNTFRREISAEKLVGAFELELHARDPFEEATAPTITDWPIAASGATLELAAEGNVESPAIITLIAAGDVVGPSFSDGERALAYAGTVVDGQELRIDGGARTVTLDGEDVTAYTAGAFPLIAPEGTTLTYTDDPSGSHTASASVEFRDRWW